MGTWVWSGKIALLMGSLAFLLLLLPVLGWQYRRYGQLSLPRLLGAAATSLYLTALVSYTWLPLPERGQEQCVDGPQLQPFHFVTDIQRVMASPGWTGFATSATVLQVVFNVVLFIPWGVIARRYVGLSVLGATVTGLLASLVIETTQLTGLWGIYSCAYRLADVDDLITNTLGALIGAVVAPLLLWWMPRADELSTARLAPRPVTGLRRILSMLLEVGATALVTIGVAVGLRLVGAAYDQELTASWLRDTQRAGAVVAWLVVFALPALTGRGSLGLAATWLRPVWGDDRQGRGDVRSGGVPGLARASVVSGPWLASTLAQDVGWLMTVVWLLVIASLVSALTTRGHRGLSFWVTGAELRDARERSAAPPQA